MNYPDEPIVQVQGVFPVSARISHELMAHEATLRDYFAAHAMHGLLASVVSAPRKEFAAEAYAIADAMLEARKEQK